MFGLDSLLDDGEPPSTEMSFDPSFREVVQGARVRGAIRRRSGAEVGFDLGDEGVGVVAATEAYIHDHLMSGRHLEGTRY
jgi:hypothetical protein